MTPAARADELLQQLDLEEKLALLHQWNPAMRRLGLPAFRTGTEALHGVAWLGEATVFPQPVGLGATWDPELVERVGAAVAAEVLAKHAADEAVSLNVWAPVVDPLRHPLWGRNEEGFSEDPHLTSDLATAYGLGLRGRGGGWRTVPTLKHLLAYNVEQDRDVLSMQVRDRVLHEYELPAFVGPLRAGAAGAVMPGYNLVNGRPAHTSGELIEHVRRAAPDDILVVSDAGAPTNLVARQACHEHAAQAHAAALRAGVDSFTDNDNDAGPTVLALRSALAQGLITEADIDRAARRVLITRARVGAVGTVGTVGTVGDPSPQPVGDLDQLLREHADLAREAATRAVVVLRDEGHAVPAAPRRIAILGPLADRVLPDWYAGTPRYPTSIADAAAQRWPDAEMTIIDGSDHVALRLTDGRYLAADDSGGLVAAAGSLAVATRLAVLDWGWGTLTVADTATGLLWCADERGTVRATSDRPHGWVVHESFRRRTATDGTIALQHIASGRWLRVEASGALTATAESAQQATWFQQHMLRSGTAAVAAAAEGADLVLCTLGNDPHLLGRETQDRSALTLPPSQLSLWEAVRSRADHAVLALVSSYPYAFDVDARMVLWTCHSQAVGHGVIDIVSGDVAPSARLPQTWWREERDAGSLTDYDIVASGTTYWYSSAEPLYPFGHGLTGSSIGYRSLEVVTIDDGGVTVAVTVGNDGTTTATEVIQVYTDAVAPRVPFPHRLGGYARATLAPGQERRVLVQVPLDRFQIWDTARAAMLTDPGRYRLSSGPSAGDARVWAEIDLDGPAPQPHRLPLRACAFDDLTEVTLVAETPERATAVAGPGTITMNDVEGLDTIRRLRAARSGHGPARIELSTLTATGWRAFAEAQVPEHLEQHMWTDLEVGLLMPPQRRGPLQVRITGPARLSALE